MVYAYPYTLARRAVVATLDLTATNLHLLRTNHWLKNERNVKVLVLTSPAWQGAPPAQLQLAPRDVLRLWTVEEVGRYYKQQDAEALASVLQANAVNGADLLAFTSWEELATELRATHFAAKKIFRLRQAFLDGQAPAL